MKYKEIFYFVTTCLTISFEDKNRQAIESQLKLNTIDWDAVIKLSTSHYVLPALYCNLRKQGFLHYLPKDLVIYMEQITNINRDRNHQIIKQAKKLNTLLLTNKITPIFLKGTGNLLAGLYDDVAERMIGDIDFIFSKELYPRAITVLRDNGYLELVKSDNYYPYFMHYPRLKKENNIAAVEIHKELLLEKYADEFNYSFVKKDCQYISGITVLSYPNKLNFSIISSQINDYRFYYKTITLRNAYDVFLLSKKTKALEAVNRLHKLKHPLNCFLAACFEVFNKVDSLKYRKTKKTGSYLNVFKNQLTNIKKAKRHHNRIKIYLFIKFVLSIIFKSIFYKEHRIWFFKNLTNKDWYKKKLIQLGIK